MTNYTNLVPVRPASRDAVYDVIDGERDYQDMGKGNAAPHPEGKRSASDGLSLGEGILCMERILDEARAAWYKGPEGQTLAMPFIRKTAGVAVQLMEHFGAVPREWHVPPSAGITGEVHLRDLGDTLSPGASTVSVTGEMAHPAEPVAVRHQL